jgi:hypothetical protein
MLACITKRPRWGLILGGLAVAICALGAAAPAEAYGWRHGWYGPRIGVGFGFYPWGYAYAPPAPVYYAPPPVYYPPAYYPGAVATTSTVIHHTTHRVHHTAHHSAANCAAAPYDHG